MPSEPPWPALMDDRTAAAYLRLGRGSLRSLLAREGVSPVPLGLRLRRWRRTDLDALLARLPQAADARDPAGLALAAIERRLARAPRRGGRR